MSLLYKVYKEAYCNFTLKLSVAVALLCKRLFPRSSYCTCFFISIFLGFSTVVFHLYVEYGLSYIFFFVRMSWTVVHCSSYEVKLLTRLCWERLYIVGFICLHSKVRPSRSWGLDWRLCHSVKILSAHLQRIHTLRFCKWRKMAIETKICRTTVQSISHSFSSNLRTCSCSIVTIWRINCNPVNLLRL